MKTSKVATLTLIVFFTWLFTANANADHLEPEHREVVKNFIDAIKSNSKAKVSNYISYPLERDSPIPSIESKQQFVERYDEVFDDNLIKLIVNSNLEEDWDVMGWRGIMFDSGQIWLDYDGTVRTINYQSKTEKKIKVKLIEAQKATLHQSLREYSEPILEWRTKKFRIRIDYLANKKYRYAAWAVNKKVNNKPDMLLFDDRITFNGSGGNHTYTFSNGVYQYNCIVNVIGSSETSAGELKVYKDGKLILSNPVIEVLM